MGPTSWHRILANRFRPGRMELFLKIFAVTTDTKILDVGGEAELWGSIPLRPQVTLLNYAASTRANGLPLIVADARNIPVADKSYDICFSNSLIEHLWNWEGQVRVANEIRRVAKHYFVQTPNYWFPIEPHFLMPFFQYLPMPVRERLAFCTPWQLMDRSPREDLLQLVHELQLLTARRMRRLFPEARIIRERFLGLTKSLIAVGPQA